MLAIVTMVNAKREPPINTSPSMIRSARPILYGQFSRDGNLGLSANSLWRRKYNQVPSVIIGTVTSMVMRIGMFSAYQLFDRRLRSIQTVMAGL